MHRNHFQYGATKAESLTRKNDKANQDIQEAFKNKDLIPLRDRSRLYTTDLPTIQALPLPKKLNWLNFYQLCCHPPPDDPNPLPQPSSTLPLPTINNYLFSAAYCTEKKTVRHIIINLCETQSVEK